MTEAPVDLEARKGTHGDFRVQFECSQRLHTTAGEFANGRMTMVQDEALSMIVMKISRILTGDPNHADHWADIAGYATLIANELSGAR